MGRFLDVNLAIVIAFAIAQNAEAASSTLPHTGRMELQAEAALSAGSEGGSITGIAEQIQHGFAGPYLPYVFGSERKVRHGREMNGSSSSGEHEIACTERASMHGIESCWKWQTLTWADQPKFGEALLDDGRRIARVADQQIHRGRLVRLEHPYFSSIGDRKIRPDTLDERFFRDRYTLFSRLRSLFSGSSGTGSSESGPCRRCCGEKLSDDANPRRSQLTVSRTSKFFCALGHAPLLTKIIVYAVLAWSAGGLILFGGYCWVADRFRPVRGVIFFTCGLLMWGFSYWFVGRLSDAEHAIWLITR